MDGLYATLLIDGTVYGFPARRELVSLLDLIAREEPIDYYEICDRFHDGIWDYRETELIFDAIGQSIFYARYYEDWC